MFEQTFVHQAGAARKPWPVAASLTGQLLVVGIVLTIPLMNTARITFTPPQILYAPIRLVQPPPELQAQASASSPSPAMPRAVFQPRLLAPTHVPERIATSAGEPMEAPPSLAITGQGPQSLGLPFGDVISNVKPPPPAAAAPVKKPVPVHVGGAVQQAMLIAQTKPPYPPLARSARVSGMVRLTAVIAPDGTIQKLQVISGHPLLVPAALQAVGQWRYRPTLLNGEPVEVITEIDVNFTLSN